LEVIGCEAEFGVVELGEDGLDFGVGFGEGEVGVEGLKTEAHEAETLFGGEWDGFVVVEDFLAFEDVFFGRVRDGVFFVVVHGGRIQWAMGGGQGWHGF
jgi:hypothetical protein